MKILSLDLSINCPGWCVANDDQYIASGYQEQENKRATVYSRIEKNLLLINTLVYQNDIEAVWMEDTAPSGRGRTSQMLTEQMGIVKYWCKERNIPVFTFSITAIKKHCTGKGTADKAEMIAAIQSKGYPHVYQNDEADAVAIWLCGLDQPFAEVAN